MSEPFVVAGCPARQRAWVLPHWLAALSQQSRQPDAIFVLVGDSTDGSEAVLAGADADFEVFDTGHPHFGRGPGGYTVDGHANNARVRNRWVERALERWPQAAHLWSVDSDVLPAPDVLELLLAADKDLVGPAVPVGGTWNFMLGLDDDGNPRRTGLEAMMAHPQTNLRPRVEPFPVTFVGCSFLVRREIFDVDRLSSHVRHANGEQGSHLSTWFAPHPQAEDVAFCNAARAAGYALWLEPRARCQHWMNPEEEPLS